MSHKLPKSVSIGGRTLKVVFSDNDGDHGRYDHDAGELQIDERYRNSTSRMAWFTLYHEMVHASLAIGGVKYVLGSKLEEAVTRNIEQLLVPAILENPSS